jgi:hypothetical protein
MKGISKIQVPINREAGESLTWALDIWECLGWCGEAVKDMYNPGNSVLVQALRDQVKNCVLCEVVVKKPVTLDRDMVSQKIMDCFTGIS